MHDHHGLFSLAPLGSSNRVGQGGRNFGDSAHRHHNDRRMYQQVSPATSANPPGRSPGRITTQHDVESRFEKVDGGNGRRTWRRQMPTTNSNVGFFEANRSNPNVSFDQSGSVRESQYQSSHHIGSLYSDSTSVYAPSDSKGPHRSLLTFGQFSSQYQRTGHDGDDDGDDHTSRDDLHTHHTGKFLVPNPVGSFAAPAVGTRRGLSEARADSRPAHEEIVSNSPAQRVSEDSSRVSNSLTLDQDSAWADKYAPINHGIVSPRHSTTPAAAVNSSTHPAVETWLDGITELGPAAPPQYISGRMAKEMVLNPAAAGAGEEIDDDNDFDDQLDHLEAQRATTTHSSFREALPTPQPPGGALEDSTLLNSPQPDSTTPPIASAPSDFTHALGAVATAVLGIFSLSYIGGDAQPNCMSPSQSAPSESHQLRYRGGRLQSTDGDRRVDDDYKDSCSRQRRSHEDRPQDDDNKKQCDGPRFLPLDSSYALHSASPPGSDRPFMPAVAEAIQDSPSTIGGPSPPDMMAPSSVRPHGHRSKLRYDRFLRPCFAIAVAIQAIGIIVEIVLGAGGPTTDMLAIITPLVGFWAVMSRNPLRFSIYLAVALLAILLSIVRSADLLLHSSSVARIISQQTALIRQEAAQSNSTFASSEAAAIMNARKAARSASLLPPPSPSSTSLGASPGALGPAPVLSIMSLRAQGMVVLATLLLGLIPGAFFAWRLRTVYSQAVERGITDFVQGGGEEENDDNEQSGDEGHWEDGGEPRDDEHGRRRRGRRSRRQRELERDSAASGGEDAERLRLLDASPMVPSQQDRTQSQPFGLFRGHYVASVRGTENGQ